MIDDRFHKPLKVAVIDDNTEFGTVVKMLLAKEGVEVHTSVNGLEGLELVKQLLPDIVLLEAVMPGMDGIEVCKKIRQTPELSGVYIVMLSGTKIHTDQLAEGLEAGADGYIARPISNRELLARLRAYMRMKRAEKALEITEKKYRRIADNITDVVWITDLNFNITYVSPSIWKQIGVSPQEYLSMGLDEKLPPQFLKKYQEILFQELQKEKDPDVDKDRSIVIEGEHYKPDGSTINISMHVTFIRDENENPVGIQGVTRDITKQKETERRIALVNQQLKYHIENSPLAVIEWDQNSKIKRWTTGAEEFFGWKEEEVINKYLTDLKFVHEDDAQKVNSLMSSLLNGKVKKNISSNRNYAKDGSIVHCVWFNSVMMDENGEILSVLSLVHNVTERKKAEKALKESELTFRKLFEESSDPILLIDETGVYVECNQAALNLLKTTREQFLFLAPENISPEFQPSGKTSKESAIEVMDLAYKKGLHRFEWIHVNAEGGEFIVDVSLMPVVIKGKTMLHTTWRNITDRKKAEEALRESEEQLKAIFENSLNPILIADDAGNFLKANQAAAKLFQHPIEQLLQMNVGDLQTSTSPEAATLFQKYIRKGIDIGELKIVYPDGSEAITQYHAVRVRENFNLGILSDITKRKKAEEALRLSEARFRTIFEIASLGIAQVDPADGRILLINNYYEAITGYRIDELLKMTFVELTHPDDREKDWEIFSKAAIGEIEYENEKRYVKKDGTIVWVRIHLAFIRDEKSNPIRTVAICEDITERKQAERDLQKLEIARKTASFKQNFLASMSHEIRTPLTGVLGMIDILELTRLNEEQLDYLNTLKTSGENLKEIINQVLDFSKIEAGKVELTPLDFEFQSILQDAEMLYRNIKRPGVKLQIQLDPAIPRFIKTDKIRLSQVINNLVSNAIKFTHEGSVSVQARLLDEITEEQQVKIEVKVVDTGIGVPAHLQEKLFIPFLQVDDNDTRYFEGTGLGLSICKELVGLLGGEIGLESERNKGSTFWFTFTARVAESQQKAESLQPKYPSQQSLHILFTEDKVVNQKVISLMLKALGHKVTIANNGAQAIDLYEAGKFDLILMDIQMPVMNGITATQILKEKYTDLPPVIGLSANAFEGDREKYMALGMDEYLVKPVKRDDLHKMFQHFFSGDKKPGKV